MKTIKKLEDEKTLDELFKKSKVILFKNSMSCGISRNARGQLEKYAAECDVPVEIYMVDVINERSLSKKIETMTGVHHESPQAFCIEQGKVVWHASHYKITAEELKKVVEITKE